MSHTLLPTALRLLVLALTTPEADEKPECHEPDFDLEALALPPIPAAEGGARFHRHLEACAQCREQPFALCPRGLRLLQEAGGNPPASCRKEPA